MGMVEKEGRSPVLHTNNPSTFFFSSFFLLLFSFFFFFFLPTAEINARLMGKICENLPVTEGLKIELSC